jgi:hypothetical protein
MRCENIFEPSASFLEHLLEGEVPAVLKVPVAEQAARRLNGDQGTAHSQSRDQNLSRNWESEKLNLPMRA